MIKLKGRKNKIGRKKTRGNEKQIGV